MAASGPRPTVVQRGRTRGTVWHTLRVRAPAVIALAAVAVALAVVSAATARTTASAGARAAVVSGTLGTVAKASASGDDGTLTVHDLTITDSAGKPFIAVESASSKYSVMSLLRKRIWLDQVYVVRPRAPPNPWSHPVTVKH